MEENTQTLSSIIARSRTFLMGLAMIVIMLFHNSFGVLGYFALPFSVYGHWGGGRFYLPLRFWNIPCSQKEWLEGIENILFPKTIEDYAGVNYRGSMYVFSW